MNFLIRRWKISTATFLIITVTIYVIVSSFNNYPEWTMRKVESNEWVGFSWVQQELGGQNFDKAGINVYCKVEGFKNTFSFQLDLGAELTGVYENTYSSLPQIEATEIKKFKSKLLFLNEDQYIDGLTISFGSYQFKTKKGYVYNEMGEFIKKHHEQDTIHLGTLGRDIFKNKVLLIDYVNNRFKILKHLPKKYDQIVSKIEIDRTGKVVLPMVLNGRRLKITFDTGSSLFPLIASEGKISSFTNSKSLDTLTIESWGRKHQVDGKMIKLPFTIANQSYKDVKVYVNRSGLGIDESTDGMAGNALFFNQMIVIDFKNQLFGIIETKNSQ
jgi:hypothetical protein